jgi:hypothetical protein
MESLRLLRLIEAGLHDRSFMLFLVFIQDVELASFDCELYLVAH